VDKIYYFNFCSHIWYSDAQTGKVHNAMYWERTNLKGLAVVIIYTSIGLKFKSLIT
jgi:hypothetical protein